MMKYAQTCIVTLLLPLWAFCCCRATIPIRFICPVYCFEDGGNRWNEELHYQPQLNRFTAANVSLFYAPPVGIGFATFPHIVR